MSPVIEVVPLSTGKLLLSAGTHCVEVDNEQHWIEAGIDALADKSGVDRLRIQVVVARMLEGVGA